MFLADGRLLADRVYDTKGRKTAFAQPEYASDVSPDGKRFVDSDKRVVDAANKVLASAPTKDQISELWLARDPDVFVGSKGAGYRDIVTWRTGDRAVRTLVSSENAAKTGGDEGVHGFDFPAPYDQVFVAMGRRLLGVSLDGKRVFRSDWITRAQLGHGSTARTAKQLVAVADRCAYRVDAKGDLVLGRILCAARPSTLSFDERGEKLVSLPWDGTGLMTYDTKTGALVAARLHSHPFPDSGATLVAAAKDPALAKKIEQALAKAKVKPGNYDLSPDGKLVFVHGSYQESAIIDLTTGRARKVLEDFVVSGDGKRIAIRRADDEKQIDVRTVDGDRLIRTLPTPTILIDRSMFSYDGSVWAVEGNGTVDVLDVATGKSLFQAPCRGSYTGHVELSHDGRLLVCDTRDATLVYDVRTKKQVKRVAHPWSEAVDTFALSPDGKQLAIGADNIVLIDLK
jgi:WD40 repeat protein